MQIWPAKNPDFSWLKVIAYTLYAIGEFYYQAKEPDVLCFNLKLPKILMGILSRPTDERHANSRAFSSNGIWVWQLYPPNRLLTLISCDVWFVPEVWCITNETRSLASSIKPILKEICTNRSLQTYLNNMQMHKETEL